MSADNWAICPHCAAQPNPYHEKLDHTLREDYDIGIDCDEKEFHVFYRGQCESCGFEFTFSQKKQIAEGKG